MPLTINVNGLTLVHKASNGQAIATVPDVCNTPSPAGPIPTPYPNIAMSKDLVKGTTSVKVDGGNMAANYGSELMLSTGDEPGTAGGVVSLTFIKEATWMLYSFDVMLEGKGACRLTDKMFMNHMNTVCLGGFIQEFLSNSKNKNKSVDDACKALLERIQELVDGSDKMRGLDGEQGRFHQNEHGGSLGPQGAPNAPPNHPPSKDFPTGANDWETHDQEIKKQQEDLQKKINEYDRDCGDPPRRMRKEMGRFREWVRRERPKKEDWKGPLWAPPVLAPEPVRLTHNDKLVIVGGLCLIVVGVAAALFSGGSSLAAAAAGVAIVGGATAAGAGASGAGDPNGA